MQCITKWESCYRRWGAVAHTVAVLSLVVLTAAGIRLESIGGWIVCPPQTVVLEGGRQKELKRRAVACGSTWRMRHWLRSWAIPAIRSEALMALVFLSGVRGWEWVWVLPWAAWLWKGVGMAWPKLRQQPVYEGIGWMWEKASGVALVGLGLAWVARQLPVGGEWDFSTFAIGSCIQGCASRPDVEVEQDETGVYAVLALLCLPCLAKREGVLILALIPLVLAYPIFALFLPLVPVLAGLLGGRWLGPYTAAVAALVLVILGLVAGQVMIGVVYVGGDQDPLMAGENMAFVTEKMPLMPPRLYEDSGFVQGFRQAVCEGDGGSVAAWLFVMAQWWAPMGVIGTVLALAELGPRLLVPHVVGLAALWAAAAGVVAWRVWWIRRNHLQGDSLPGKTEESSTRKGSLRG